MKEKEILEKTWLLSEERKFKEVVDLIEGLSREERTPQLVLELAKAYRDLAVF